VLKWHLATTAVSATRGLKNLYIKQHYWSIYIITYKIQLHRDKLNVANTEQDLSEPRYLTSWMWLDVAKKDEILENMFMVCACLGLGARTKGACVSHKVLFPMP
jgi:hypothetical protein